MSAAYITWKTSYPLHAAAQLGDIAALTTALQDLSTTPSPDGTTKSTTEVINSRDNEQWTALLYACFEGHAETIAWLIANGADVTIGNHFGSTPLHLTIGTGNIDATKAILNSIDNLEVLLIKNHDKQIPRQMLMIADSNQKEIRGLLDQKEAELKAKKGE